MTEREIQKALVQHIKQRIRPNVAWHANCAERSAGPKQGAFFKSMGVRAGVPDLYFIKAGKLHALEVKKDKGRLLPSQTEMHAELMAAGAEVSVAYGLDEALFHLEDWGLIK